MKAKKAHASYPPCKSTENRILSCDARTLSDKIKRPWRRTTVSSKWPAWFGLAALSLAAMPAVLATDFYVSPNGSSSGDGSSGKPWNLQTALNQPGSVKPGDTIWMKGGTYKGPFESRLNGSSGKYITVRQAPGERAIIDGSGSSENTLDVEGSWACFWGFEVTNTDSNRPKVQWSRPHGVTVNGPNTRFVNLIVHDAGQGFGAWESAVGAEIYGCVIFNNGNSSLDHGIYSQNATGTKRIADNIILNNYGYGLHIYGSEDANLRGFDIQGNTLFNNGSLSKTDAQNIIIMGSNPMEQVKLTDNCTYSGFMDGSVTIGSDAHNKDLTLQRNYFVDETRIRGWQTISASGNTLVSPNLILDFTADGGLPDSAYNWNGNSYFGEELDSRPFALRTSSGSRSTDFAGWKSGSGLDASSTYVKGRATGTKIFIRPNQYEPGRAHITVYNWDLRSSVSVDLSSFLASGTRYEIRSAQNYLGSPVLSGTYNGGAVSLPMSGLSVAAPYGLSTPASTGPEFNAFVVIPLSTSTTPPSNTPPTISTIADQVINANSATTALSFTVGDAQTPAAQLSVLGSSSNPTLVPNDNIRLGGSGANRTVMVTPAANQSGVSTITLSVVDGSLITTKSFKLTVNPANGGSTPPSSGKVTIALEAESGILAGPMTVVSNSGAQQGKYIVSNTANSGTATYTVTIPTAGQYVIWCRVLANDGTGRGDHDSVFVSVDGAEDVYDVAEGIWANRWQWTSVNGRAGGSPLALNPRVLNLTAGQHKIVIRGREAGTIVDSIVLTNDRAFVPAP